MSPVFRALLVVVVVGVAVAACGGDESSEPAPPTLSNGDFESGDLTGWTTESRGRGGEWYVYEDGGTAPNPLSDSANAGFEFDMLDPPEGRYAAVTDPNAEGLRLLYRDLAVGGPWMLHATVFYENHFSPGFGSPRIHAPADFGTIDPSLGLWQAGDDPNQQFRIDLIDPAAELISMAPEDILATVFWTQEGDPSNLAPTPITFDLSPYEGETIRLRIAELDNRGPLRAGIDDVRLELSP